MRLIASCDGGCEPNPGEMSIGILVKRREGDEKKKDEVIAEISERIGEGTNNVAEYSAVVRALEYIQKLFMDVGDIPDLTEINILSDSELVVNQCSGAYDCNAPHLAGFLDSIKEYREFFMKANIPVRVNWIPGYTNLKAHSLALKALMGDGKDYDKRVYENEMLSEIKKGNLVIPLSIFRKKNWRDLTISEAVVMQLLESRKLTVSQVAKELRRDYQTVRTQYNRAKKKIRR
jgi:ribonuclease HI